MFYLPNTKFIFKVSAPKMAAASLSEEEQARKFEAAQQEAKRKQDRQTMESNVARLRVSPEVKQKLREDLASENPERWDLVERFLRMEISSEEFEAERKSLETEDKSWETIFATQREVRKKILDLQYRTESYVELLPHKAAKFESLLKDVRGINKQDKNNDRDLKNVLGSLATQDEKIKEGPFITPEAAREIYEVDPLQAGFESTLKKYSARIAKAPDGANIFKRLIALKQEEGRIERQFLRLYNLSERIIANNMDKVRRKAEEEKILKTASQVVGITLKPGTEIEFQDQGILALPSDRTSVKIARITFDEIITRYHEGKVIGKRPGFPIIHLGQAKMTLGRFKKWVDAVDAVEKVSSLDDVEIRLGLAAYGIKIQKGMELFYSRRTVDAEGKPASTPSYVRITDIKNRRISFSEPVLFQPGFDIFEEYDMRKSLTLGEFVKWFRRYEVEKSISLQEVRELLLKHNEIENKTFGIEAKENPPILVEEKEVLRYPDESGLTMKIVKVGTDGVYLDTGRKYTFPEFFYWVKNNYVEKVPEKETPEQQAAREKREYELEKQRFEKEEEAIEKRALGSHRREAVAEHLEEYTAGTPLMRLKQIWWSTQLLSLKDLWNMTLEVVEFVKRKHQRRSKGRFGEVGSRLPSVLGTEFERIKQAAENEEVSKYKEAMEHWGIPQVQRTLHTTNSKDEAKACIMTLIHKGEMRWDDPEMWKTLNRLTARYTTRGTELYIPEPEYMPQGESGEDMALKAIDILWGEGQGAEWFAENTSKYNSMKNNFEYKFKQLENDPKQIGGPAGACYRMLKDWREGKYVNGQEYEEMIDAAIKYGKMTTLEKMFYLIAGVIARKGNDLHGETLLHMDRIGELNSKYLNQFPMLDFFTQERKMDFTLWNEEEGKLGKSRKLKLDDLEEWMLQYFPSDFENNKPAHEFSQFLWEVMMMSDATRTRISKGIRNAENIDHDDAHLILSAVTPTEIDEMTTGPSGHKKYFTNEGYMNGYPGFNQFILSLSYGIEEELDEEKKQYKFDALRDAVNSFIRFDTILDNRLHKEKGTQYARLDDRHYSRATVVDKSGPLHEHQEQLRNLIREIGREYGEDFSFLYGDKTGSMLDPKELEKQKLYERKIDDLKDTIARFFLSDGGKKALEVIQRARARDAKAKNGLRGQQGNERPTAEQMEARKRKARELMMAKGRSH